MLLLLTLLPLDVIPPSPAATAPVYPQQSHGFAAYLIGGFFALGVLILAAILLSIKPKRASGR